MSPTFLRSLKPHEKHLSKNKMQTILSLTKPTVFSRASSSFLTCSFSATWRVLSGLLSSIMMTSYEM